MSRSRTLRSRLRVRAADDAGFSLPELLVSITILTIVSAAIVASTAAIQRNLGVANATMNDMAANRIAIERMGQLVRGAVTVNGNLARDSSALDTTEPPRADRVTFFSVTGQTFAQNPNRVRLQVVGTDLVETIWAPRPLLSNGTTPTFPNSGGRQRVIARNITNPAVFQLWSHYFDDDLGPISRCGRQIAFAGIAVDGMESVDSVSYRLVVNEPDGYESAPSDLQGWARFASNIDLGSSSSFESEDCLNVRGFGYEEVYEVAP